MRLCVPKTATLQTSFSGVEEEHETSSKVLWALSSAEENWHGGLSAQVTT